VIFLNPDGFSQVINSDTSESKIVIAGKEYKKSGFHQWLWGKNGHLE